MATIKIKRSTTASAVGPNTAGEISTNLADKKLFIGTGSAVLTFPDATQITQEINTAIGALSSAFEYKGAVAGNGQASTVASGDISEATALAEDPSTGDYYRISTAGFVKAFGAADTAGFYLNIGDAVVYNGNSWDTIDNTNSGISAADSGDDIAVSGSADAGFTIGFASTAKLDQATQVVDGGTFGSGE
jgi:hypothetical protein|tara:strand:+ start:1635 stop:2204 length:570 start_codon:yes stop_codon:yes gene_type:complete